MGKKNPDWWNHPEVCSDDFRNTVNLFIREIRKLSQCATAVNVYDVSNSACRCRFVIGRERPGQQSEVATLIQQTLEQERRQRELLEQQYAQYDADDDEVMTTHTHHSLHATVRWLPVCA